MSGELVINSVDIKQYLLVILVSFIFHLIVRGIDTLHVLTYVYKYASWNSDFFFYRFPKIKFERLFIVLNIM